MAMFDGKTAIVTGASRGIGLAIAARLVSGGARVVITAREPVALSQAVEQLGGTGKALGIAGHADDLTHQRDVVRRAIQGFGSADILVNNIGINPAHGRLVDLSLDVARKTVDVNCIAALSWIQQIYRLWLQSHGGAIVNVSSVAGKLPSPGIGFYGATKSMLIHMTEELAVELGPGIRVNAVAPAVVKTKFATALYEGREHHLASRYPLKRLGEPEDVAGAVAFLLSRDADWMTGHTLVVDGGRTLTGAIEPPQAAERVTSNS